MSPTCVGIGFVWRHMFLMPDVALFVSDHRVGRLVESQYLGTDSRCDRMLLPTRWHWQFHFYYIGWLTGCDNSHPFV